MNGWNTIVSFWDGLFSGAFAVSFREGLTSNPGCFVGRQFLEVLLPPSQFFPPTSHFNRVSGAFGCVMDLLEVVWLWEEDGITLDIQTPGE